jgi:hypothetical protein
MRYVVQFLIPALVVIIVALVLVRSRGVSAPSRAAEDVDSAPKPLSTGVFVLILLAAAVFTVVLVYALQGFH